MRFTSCFCHGRIHGRRSNGFQRDASTLCALQTRGADPSVRAENYDPYLSPGLNLDIEVAVDDDELRGKLKALDKKYAKASGPAMSTSAVCSSHTILFCPLLTAASGGLAA